MSRPRRGHADAADGGRSATTSRTDPPSRPPDAAATAVEDDDAERADEVREAAERDAAEPHVDVATGFGQRLLAAVTGTNVVVTTLALVSALALGAVVIAASEEPVRAAAGYFFDRPSDTFRSVWDAVSAAYAALFRGALGGAAQLSETGVAAIPLILAGLAVTIPLRAGLFNIGGEGQVLVGGLLAGLVGFGVTGLPLALHLPLAVVAGLAGGAAWGFVPGILKARTGAHEVIVTIMLNYVAIRLTDFTLTTTLFLQPGRFDPISKPIRPSATLPLLVGPGLRIHAGLLLAVVAAAVMWWLLERSTTGFELNAVGLNPNAATVAGMSVPRSVVTALSVGGAMAGLAGTAQVLGVQGRIIGGFSAGLGFDGITVALLGRASVGGTVAAGLLFGALKAGGRTMQAVTGTSLDLVVVIQALVILFVAAPALVRALYRIRTVDTGTGQIAKGWGA